jgi:hypothetical protein
MEFAVEANKVVITNVAWPDNEMELDETSAAFTQE